MPHRKPDPPKRRRAHYYAWTLANTLMACLAILSWVLCLHVFGHPEIPRNYAWLAKLGRIDPAPGFTLQEAPPGEAADPPALFRRYAQLPAEAMTRLNAALMRNYLTSLGEPKLIQYVEGDFRVLDSRPLDAGDLFAPGFAVRAQAMVQPDEFSEAAPYPVVIDYLFPTPQASAHEWFRTGDQLEVSKVPNCALLLRVAREDGGDTPVARLTVVPVAMGEYRVGKERTFRLETPASLNPGARFPIFAAEE